MPGSSKTGTTKEKKLKSEKASKKSKQVVETEPAAQSTKIQAASKLVLALKFSAPQSSKKVAPFVNYPVNTVIVVPASSSNLDYFHESCVEVGRVTFG